MFVSPVAGEGGVASIFRVRLELANAALALASAHLTFHKNALSVRVFAKEFAVLLVTLYDVVSKAKVPVELR